MARLFRPTRTVTDPSGRQWELYVSRIALPAWKEEQPDSWVDDTTPADGPTLFLLALPFAILGFLWSSIVVPLVRAVFLTPSAVLRGRRSRTARIEAVTWFPSRETRTWTTPLERANSVLEEIARGLSEGKVVQPVGAVYSGSVED